LQATAELFHHGSVGHWQWPMWPIKMVIHLIHDPLTSSVYAHFIDIRISW